METLKTKQAEVPLKPSKILRSHFLSLGRRLSSWCSNNDAFTLGVTSLKTREGRSTVASNLAAAMVNLHSESILLVQSDLAGPIRRKAIGPGLVEVLLGDVAPEDAIAPTSVENLDILRAGAINDHEALELPLEAIESLNADLESSYKYIIYDLSLIHI